MLEEYSTLVGLASRIRQLLRAHKPNVDGQEYQQAYRDFRQVEKRVLEHVCVAVDREYRQQSSVLIDSPRECLSDPIHHQLQQLLTLVYALMVMVERARFDHSDIVHDTSIMFIDAQTKPTIQTLPSKQLPSLALSSTRNVYI